AIESAAPETSSNGNVEVKIVTDKERYPTKSPIRLELDLPSAGTFSISVTDQSAVPELQSPNSINNLLQPIAGENAGYVRLSHQMEKGISLHGKVYGREGVPYDIMALLR